MTSHESERLTDLREEARYRNERLALYKARLYAGRPLHAAKLRELKRAADGASSRLRRAEAPHHRPS
jgi:hypothetical protein